MKYYVIDREFGSSHYRVLPDGAVQNLWRGVWVDCAYECEEELVADGAFGDFDFSLN